MALKKNTLKGRATPPGQSTFWFSSDNQKKEFRALLGSYRSGAVITALVQAYIDNSDVRDKVKGILG